MMNGSVDPFSIAFGDIDGDGVNDVAISSIASDHFSWLRNSGNGSFDPTLNVVSESTSARAAIGIAIADVYVLAGHAVDTFASQ